MTEQQRREQIMKMRQQVAPPAAPTLTDAEAQKLVANTNALTQEQMIAIAMFGKIVQNDVNGIKKAALGDLKVSDVDMSKVMPSGIARSIGTPLPQIPVDLPVNSNPQTIAPSAPASTVSPVIPILPSVQNNLPVQLELDFDKKARYIEVVEAINLLEKKVELINIKLDQLLESNKKKLNQDLTVNGIST